MDHLVEVDLVGAGPAQARNKLAANAETEWVLPLDDDDLLDPDCVEYLLANTAGGDVVYPWCRVVGKQWCPNRLFTPDALLESNFIPVTALIRRELWLELGGMNEDLRQFEDYDFWRRCLGAGAMFVCVPEVLWTYRILVAGDSRNAWEAA